MKVLDPGGGSAVHSSRNGIAIFEYKCLTIRLWDPGALLSGNANNGANAGFGYLNANNRSSNANANIGFRFYRGYLITGFSFYNEDKEITVDPMTSPHRGCRHCWQLVE